MVPVMSVKALMEEEFMRDMERLIGDLPVHSPQIQDLPRLVVVAEALEIFTHHSESPDLFDGDVGQDVLRESLVGDVKDGHAEKE